MESFSYVVLIIIEFPIFSLFYLFVLPFLYMANQQGSPTAPINITGSTHKRRHSSSIGSLSKLPVLSASWGSLRGMSVSIGTIPHFFYVLDHSQILDRSLDFRRERKRHSRLDWVCVPPLSTFQLQCLRVFTSCLSICSYPPVHSEKKKSYNFFGARTSVYYSTTSYLSSFYHCISQHSTLLSLSQLVSV
jgi:hypothetical protein